MKRLSSRAPAVFPALTFYDKYRQTSYKDSVMKLLGNAGFFSKMIE